MMELSQIGGLHNSFKVNNTIFKIKVTPMNPNYLTIQIDEEQAIVMLNCEHETVMNVGELMEAVNESAYMNGYNWEAFLISYLSTHYPMLEYNMATDCEAGCFTAIFDNAISINMFEDAEQLKNIIVHLMEHPEEILIYLMENVEEIEWD